MHYYEDGDLTTLNPELKSDVKAQEQTFLQMCDCIAELHANDVYHRDIKPQNFLRHGDSIVVSDLGLSMERESLTLRRRRRHGGHRAALPRSMSLGDLRTPMPHSISSC